MLDTLIQKLAKEMEIEGSLATEVPGVYSISVDEKHVALLTSTPRGFSIRCEVGAFQPENEEYYFAQLLHANLFGRATEGALLGLDSEGKRLILSREIDYNIEYKEFKDIIEDFLNGIEFWQEEAQSYEGAKKSSR